MSIVVTRLNARQTVRLQVTANLAANAMGCQQRLDTRPDPLQLEALDRIADEGSGPSCECANADRFPAGRRRDGELALALQ